LRGGTGESTSSTLYAGAWMRALRAFYASWKPSRHRLVGFDTVVTMQEQAGWFQNAGTGNLLIAHRLAVV
jgi:hypothetical protein